MAQAIFHSSNLSIAGHIFCNTYYYYVKALTNQIKQNCKAYSDSKLYFGITLLGLDYLVTFIVPY
jgi:hypothetical protein